MVEVRQLSGVDADPAWDGSYHDTVLPSNHFNNRNAVAPLLRLRVGYFHGNFVFP